MFSPFDPITRLIHYSKKGSSDLLKGQNFYLAGAFFLTQNAGMQLYMRVKNKYAEP
jgi:hypothetical protein